jgi:hypothetical protein
MKILQLSEFSAIISSIDDLAIRRDVAIRFANLFSSSTSFSPTAFFSSCNVIPYNEEEE